MSAAEEYDVIVLGSGAPGKLLTWTLASRGKRLAVIERRYIGGPVPDIARLPSKNVIHGAKVAGYFRRGAEFGIASGDWKVETPAIRDRKRKMVNGLVTIHHEKYRESGAELVTGHVRFVAPKTGEVALHVGGTRTLRGQTVVINAGSPVLRIEGRSVVSVGLHAARGAIEGTHLLVAAGRTPNTDGIGLEEAGVEADEREHVKANERLQTTAKDVWAVGNCAGSPYFAHIGVDDFRGWCWM